MDARAKWIIAGSLVGATVLAAAFTTLLSGVGPEAARYEARLKTARTWGFDPDLARLSTHDHALPAEKRKAWSAFFARSQTDRSDPARQPAAEFDHDLAANRARFDAAVDESKRVNGGVHRPWPWGLEVTYPDYYLTRRNLRLGLRLAMRSLRQGRCDEAISTLERSRELLRPTQMDPAVLGPLVNASGAAILSRGAEAALLAPELTRPQAERIARLLRDPVFGPGPSDREVFAFEIYGGFHQVGDPAAIERDRKTDRDPSHRGVFLLAKSAEVRRAWQSDMLRIGNEIAPLFPSDPFDWEGRRLAWNAYDVAVRKDAGWPGAYRSILAKDAIGVDAKWIDGLCRRETIRRLVEFAALLRAGHDERSVRDMMGSRAIDPFDGKPIRVRHGVTEWRSWHLRPYANGDPPARRSAKAATIVYSVANDRVDDGGAPMLDGKGDAAIFIPDVAA